MTENNESSSSSSKITNISNNQIEVTRLPWGALKQQENNSLNNNLFLLNSTIINSDKKPGEYLMKLIFHNFITICNKKIQIILNGDKKVCFIRLNSNLILIFLLLLKLRITF